MTAAFDGVQLLDVTGPADGSATATAFGVRHDARIVSPTGTDVHTSDHRDRLADGTDAMDYVTARWAPTGGLSQRRTLAIPPADAGPWLCDCW